MPTLSIDELEEIAKRNLVKGDASITKVNAASRLVALPGVDAPGSTEQTNATNLSIAAAMDRADAARVGATPLQEQPAGIDIEQINQRRSTILQATERGIDPDAPALFVNPKRRQELDKELGVLNKISHDYAMEGAKNAHEALVRQRNTDVANQSTNIFNGLLNISPDGSPESEKAVKELIRNNRIGFEASSAARREVERHAKIHDKAARPLVDVPEGYEVTPTHIGAQGVSGALRPVGEAQSEATDKKQKALQEELFKGYKITPSQVLNPIKVEAGTGVAEEFKEDDKGEVYKITTDAGATYIPKAEYHRFYDAFAPQKPAATEVAAAPKKIFKFNSQTGKLE